MKASERQPWQADPSQLDKPDHLGIQYWLDSGTMITAQMPLEQAQELVKIGAAFIIGHHAIGQCVN